MNFVYTNGTNRDFISLCRLLDENLNEMLGGEEHQEQYAKYNTLGNIHDVVLIYDGEFPIACAGFKHYQAGTAEVKRVFLRKEYRGRGISKQLLFALEEKAKEKGYTSLVLETGRDLKSAMGLYRGIGFQIIENYGQYRDMEESVCMRKEFPQRAR